MLPLADSHVLEHVVTRVDSAEMVDQVVVATSEQTGDDIVSRYADRAGAFVFRGSESDVLGRMFGAAEATGADIVVRITADCPLIAPDCIDVGVETLVETGADYVSNTRQRTFPRGLDTEVFTFESFATVEGATADPYHREHVTPYYSDNSGEFTLDRFTAVDVFDTPVLHGRTDLRLTLDEADDYELLREAYRAPFDDVLDIETAVRYIDDNDLSELNSHVQQKTH